MALYFFYQETEEDQRWIPALASERDNIVKYKTPAFTTALDVDNSFSEDLTLDEIRSVRYSGPLYFDWDAESIEEAIGAVKEFLNKLKAKEVPLNMLRLYATGKKGFHLEVPMQMFMGKPPGNGIQGLPHIYKEMAHELFVETMDMRVYSARRGRQWRCVNYKRSNGKYKVQITPQEAENMTPELYDQICSTPRPPLSVEPPNLNSYLGLLFAQSRDKVEKSVAKKKSKKAVAEPLKKFGGEWPETLTGILCGALVKPDVGWNYLSFQLAITASELGKSEEQLLTDAEGLISSHESDSSRYNSPSKRRNDLREMFRYVNGNPCYEYNVGALMSILIPEVRANADIALGDYVPDETPSVSTVVETVVAEDGTVTETVVEVEVPAEDDNSPVRISKAGVFVRTDNGYASVCSVGLDNIKLLRKLDETDIGYEVNVYKNGVPKGTHMLGMDKLLSKQAFQGWSFQWSSSMGASDAQTSRIADILSHRAEKTNAITYLVGREGIDLVVKPGSKSIDDYEVIWASPSQVISTKGGNYRFRNEMDKTAAFSSDLMTAPPLTLEDAELIDNFLRINTTLNMAKISGWFSGAFLTQIVRRFFQNQFPSLQVYGEAGAGKSNSIILFNHLHYHLAVPKSIQTKGTSPYPLYTVVGTSASQPVVFEEVKKREMTKQMHDTMLNIFRSNYNAFSIERGGLSRDTATKELVVNKYTNAGPIAFVGESMEGQAAVLERCVMVSLAKTDRYGRSDYFKAVADRASELGKLGKAIALNAMAIDVAGMRDSLRGYIKEIEDAVGAKADEVSRPIFNLAVVLLGQKLMFDTLAQVFGDRYEGFRKEFHDVIINNIFDNIPSNMSETARVLDVMAMLTRNPDPNYHIARNVDYTSSADGKTIDLKLRTAYAKYARWQRSLGQEVLYDSEGAFISAMQAYGGVVKRSCPDNELLYDSPKAVVFRVSVEYMDKEGVDGFKP